MVIFYNNISLSTIFQKELLMIPYDPEIKQVVIGTLLPTGFVKKQFLCRAATPALLNLSKRGGIANLTG